MAQLEEEETVRDVYETFARSLRQRAAIDLGIAPFTETEGFEAVERHIGVRLAELPPDEARKMKRKYRKLWRQHLKKLNVGLGEGKRKRLNNQYYGLGEAPSPLTRMRRKNAVYTVMQATIGREMNAVGRIFNDPMVYFEED